MRNKRGNSSNGIDRSGYGSSTDLVSKLVRSKRAQILLLFALVVGGLLLSSLTLLMHQPNDSIDLESPISARVRALGRQAAADSAAGLAAGAGGVLQETDTEQQQQPGEEEQQQPTGAAAGRQRWQWRLTGKGAQQHKAGRRGQPQQTAGTQSQAGLDLPSNLVAQLAKQGPAVVTAAAPYKVPAAEATAAVAQVEDLSLILAASDDNTHGQQEQQQSKSLAAVPPAGVHASVDPADATSVYIKQRGVEPVRVKHPLWWHGPMWSGSGYGSEAVNFVLSALRTGRLAPADVWAYHHGDGWREHIVKSMSTEDRTELEYLQSLPAKYRHKRSAVVVCHSVPTNWAFPEPMWVAGAPCPPNPKEFPWVFSVGRTMFETHRLPAVFVPRLNAMNEIWVPSEWQRESFIASGVDATKLVVVPEGVNTSLFDPALYKPLALRDKAQLVFGKHWEAKLGMEAAAVLGSGAGATSAQKRGDDSAGAGAAAGGAADTEPGSAAGAGAKAAALATPGGVEGTDSARRSMLSGRGTSSGGNTTQSYFNRGGDNGSSSSSSGGSSSAANVRRPFRFISTFKWEQRKGWDILLEAYLTAFTAEDDVELYILTQPFGKSGSSFKDKMRSWAGKLNIKHTASASSGSSNSSRPGRSLLSSEAQQQQQQQQQPHGSYGEQQAEPAGDGDDAVWAAHVEDVVQQIRDFAGQLQHRRRHLQGIAASAQSAGDDDEAHDMPVPSGDSKHTAQRQLQQASSVKAQDLQAYPVNQAASTKGGAAPVSNAASSAPLTPAQKARARLQQLAAFKAVKQASVAETTAARFPALYIIDGHISDADFPRFYKAGDAFVLPSRGEGWGRPHVEAMSMGLPVISTNWSGITAYLDGSVGYPLAIDGLVPVSGSGDEIIWWFKGMSWAQPSVKHLVQLMRRVYRNREEAAARGAAARARMVEKYSPEAMADILVKELQRIQDKVP